MEDEDEAKVAIAELNGYELEGMNIKVEVRIEKQIYFNPHRSTTQMRLIASLEME